MKFVYVLLFFCTTFVTTAQTIVSITDFGIEPGSHSNVLPAIKQAIAFCRNKTDVILSFPTVRYDFWPVSSTDNIGFDLQNIEGMTIEGNGSEFIFHGWMQIANVDSCLNVTFRNFSVDWDRPFISQAEIV